uniref:Rubicon Homology domain-containing protein n=1 Tax=Trichobilharzia regenti TaxID=157069 RepID=A0AA85JZ73_TRIRE|nr:unnamed protein product [Trichobilharzia regenti]
MERPWDLTNREQIYPTGSNNLLRLAGSSWIEPLKTSECTNRIINVTSFETECQTSPSFPEDNTDSIIGLSKSENLASLQDDNWAVVGDDLLLTIMEEFKEDQDVERLVELFPGACKFDYENGENSVFFGRCKRCSVRLKPNHAFLDYYDACFYCVNCHQLQEAVIPRDIITNWDFSPKPVSQITHQFLSALHNRPVINLAKLNPILYAAIPDLYLIRQLRRTLVLLWHQIVQCDGKTVRKLRDCFHSRMYMLRNISDIDVYSVIDLILAHSSKLKELLKNAIENIALAHVYQCQVCRRRALLCDYCDELSKPIWTHEFSTYKHCINPGCSKVMHISCLIMSDKELMSSIGCCFERQFVSTPPKDCSELISLDIQCISCRDYRLSFSTNNQVIGHYADPFIIPKT